MKKVFLLLATLLATSTAFALDLKPAPDKPVITVKDSLFLVGEVSGGVNVYSPDFKLNSLDGNKYIWSNEKGVEMYGSFWIRKDVKNFYGSANPSVFAEPTKKYHLNMTMAEGDRKKLSFPGKMNVTFMCFDKTTQEFYYEGTPIKDFDVDNDQDLFLYIGSPKQFKGQSFPLSYVFAQLGLATYQATITIPEGVTNTTSLGFYVGDADCAKYKFASNGATTSVDSTTEYRMPFKSDANLVLWQNEGTKYAAGDKIIVIFIVAENYDAFIKFATIPSTAVDEVEAAEAIYANNGTVYAPEGAVIFNLIGQDVTALNGQLKGLYIVKAGDQTVKLNVQ